MCVCVCVYVRDANFNYIVPALDGDKRMFYKSTVKTFKPKDTKAQF